MPFLLNKDGPVFLWLPCQVFLRGSVKAPLSLSGCGFCGCLALCTALRVGQRLGVTQPSRGLSFGQGSEVFSNFASRINKVGRSDLCVTLPLVHWRGHGGLDFIIVTTFCSVRRVLKTCRQDCCGLAFKITATRALSKLLVCVVSRA